jgi:hypothetical protein
MQKLHAELDKFHKELRRLLELLAAQRQLVESQARKSAPVLQLGETAEAQLVLRAQQLLRSNPAAPHMNTNRTRVDYWPLADVPRLP